MIGIAEGIAKDTTMILWCHRRKQVENVGDYVNIDNASAWNAWSTQFGDPSTSILQDNPWNMHKRHIRYIYGRILSSPTYLSTKIGNFGVTRDDNFVKITCPFQWKCINFTPYQCTIRVISVTVGIKLLAVQESLLLIRINMPIIMIMCGMKLLIHSQTSTVPLKFGNG